MNTRTAEQLEQAIRRDGRYPPDAYDFLQRGLERATIQTHGRRRRKRPQHVSGPQLCEALRRLALEQWGPLAPAVLNHWRIHTTRDFGEMVFFLVGLGFMGKQDSDHLEDFDEVYDFETAFRYEIPLKILKHWTE